MNKYLKYILMIFLTVIICFAFFDFKSFSHYNNNQEIKKILSKEKNVTENLRVKYHNNDIIGTISVENTDINEVLVQASDNKYYLTHDIYGNYDKYGSVFLDHRCNKNSKKLLIYGHNDFKD